MTFMYVNRMEMIFLCDKNMYVYKKKLSYDFVEIIQMNKCPYKCKYDSFRTFLQIFSLMIASKNLLYVQK